MNKKGNSKNATCVATIKVKVKLTTRRTMLRDEYVKVGNDDD